MVKTTLEGTDITPKILYPNFTCIFKNFQDFSRPFSFFPSFQDFSRPGNLFFHFKVFQVAWEP